MKIRYHELKDQPPFGEAILDKRDWENWFFRVPNKAKILKIQHFEDYSCEFYDFRWIDEEKVPEYGRIQ